MFFLDKIKVKHKEYEDLESPIFNSECICVINKILGEEKSQEDIIKLKELEKNRLEQLTLHYLCALKDLWIEEGDTEEKFVKDMQFYLSKECSKFLPLLKDFSKKS